jgi:hypothetical protein
LRHSPLQELRAFVSLFRPARVVPNSLDPSLHGLDALCIPNLFAKCLSTPSSHFSPSFAGALGEGDIELNEDRCDSALQNLVGDGADSIAHAWALSGRIVDKLAVMEPFLRGTARDIVRRALGVPPLPSVNSDGSKGAVSILQRMHDRQRIDACRATVTDHESDRETESEVDDSHARTAKLLFGVPGRSLVGSQGISQGRIRRSSESPLDGHMLVQEGSEEGSPDPKVPPALHASTPPVSECNSQQTFANGTYRCRTNRDIASLQTQPINCVNSKDNLMTCLGSADYKHSSFGADAYTSSLSSLTSPARNQSHCASRHDPPLTDLQNIPLAGTKRASVHLFSSTPVKKRSKVEGWLDACTEEDTVFTSLRREATGAPGVASMKATDTAAESGCTRERDPDFNGETRGSQRRSLRARSRAIEEKLRNALANCNGSEVESYFGTQV